MMSNDLECKRVLSVKDVSDERFCCLVKKEEKGGGGKRLSSSFASRTISASHHHGVHRKISLKEQHSCYRSALNLLYAA